MEKKTEVELENKVKMPLAGLGTWRLEKKDCGKIVEGALKCGYKLIDCAPVYGNEAEVGKALKKVFDEGKIKREDTFIVSKLWNTHHGHVKEAFEQTLKNLNVEYLDLYLMHYPIGFKFTGIDLNKCDIYERDLYGAVVLQEPGKGASIQDAWKEMEKLVESGKVKAIGVSNFNIPLIYDMLTYAKIPPVVHQFECHPLSARQRLDREMKKLKIHCMGYSSLGSEAAKKELLENKTVLELAKKYKKTAAQILLRWSIDRGYTVIPKTSNEKRVKENFEILDFKLTGKEVEEILKIDEKRSVMGPFCDLAWGIDPFY